MRGPPHLPQLGGLVANTEVSALSWAESPQLPAAAFTENLNDPRQPFATVLPVDRERALQPVRVAFQKRGDNLFVLGHRNMKFSDDRTRVEPPITFGLWLDGAVQCRQARSRASLHQQAMKLVVEVKDIRAVVAVIARNLIQFVIDRLQFGGQRLTLALWKHGGAAPGQPLKAPDDRI